LIIVAIASRLIVRNMGIAPSVAMFFTLCRVDGLAIGAAAALLARSPGGLARWLPAARGIAAVCGLFVTAVILSKLFESRVWPLIAPMRLMLFAAVLVLSVAAGGAVSAVFSSRVLRFLGKYSYGLYVFHYMMMPLFNRYADEGRLAKTFGSFAVGMAARVIICLTASIVVALLSWHLYEMHFLKLKRLFARRDAKQLTPATVLAPSGIAHDEIVDAETAPGI
jgi:peptidoglycan/LPS O-acetylase OafA/YrhL